MIDWRDRTRRLMEENNMNQSALANAMGVTRATVSIWMNNKAPLSDRSLAKVQHQLASIFDVPVDYIAYGHKLPDMPSKNVPIMASEHIGDWLLNKKTPDDVMWITCPLDCGDKTFCYVMEGNSMDSCGQPGIGFPANAYVFIDPDYPVAIDAPCLFKEPGFVLGNVGQFMGKTVLDFNNPRYTTLEVQRDNFIGQAIGYTVPIRKQKQQI